MLIRITKNTMADPKRLRITLITNAQDPTTRRMWVTSTAAPDEPIEVERRLQEEVLAALRMPEVEEPTP